MSADTTPERVAVIECNLDDMTGEALGYALERLLAAGALDAWHAPIYAKKNRPAVVLTVLCREQDRERMAELMLRETTSLGVRWRLMDRVICERATVVVQTRWGAVACKTKRLHGRLLSIKPEHDECAGIAMAQGLPLEVVVAEARQLAWQAIERGDTV